MKTINKIRSKDPDIYDAKKEWFKPGDKAGGGSAGEQADSYFASRPESGWPPTQGAAFTCSVPSSPCYCCSRVVCDHSPLQASVRLLFVFPLLLSASSRNVQYFCLQPGWLANLRCPMEGADRFRGRKTAIRLDRQPAARIASSGWGERSIPGAHYVVSVDNVTLWSTPVLVFQLTPLEMENTRQKKLAPTSP